MQYWVYILIGVILFLAVAVRVAAYFILKKLYRPTKRDYEYLIDYETREKGFQKEWLEIPFLEYRRESRYGYELFARYYECPTPSKKIMIDLHGHNSCSVSQLKYLELWRSLGYNVFMPDHKRSGFSGGDTITFGATEKYDVLDWIKILKQDYPDMRFAIFGESMGAATSIMVASMEPSIEFLIEYCGYADFEGLLSKYIKNGMIRKQLAPTFNSMSRLFFKVDFEDFNVVKAFTKIDKPTLMMHSRIDKTVDFYNFEKLHAVKPDAKTHVFSDTIHVRSIVKHPEVFTKVVSEFVKEAEKQVGIE